MTLLPKAVYSFNVLPIRGPMDIQKTPEIQTDATGGITISYLMSYYRAIVIKSMVLAQNQTHRSIGRTLKRPRYMSLKL